MVGVEMKQIVSIVKPFLAERVVAAIAGKQVEEIPLGALVPLADLRTMKFLSRGYVKSGHKTVRYKLGRNIDEDIEIILNQFIIQ